MKGALLLIVGIGVLTLLHKDVAAIVTHIVEALRVDPDNYYIHRMLAKLGLMDDRKLKELSAGTFFYAALLLTEGVGLWMGKHWAEYLTIIATASFIPIEIYELLKHFTIVRVLVLGINVAVVWYLVRLLSRERKEKHAAAVSQPAD